MNNEGFTLVELLAVITILALLTVIALPKMGFVTENLKDEMLDKKLTLIEESAILLGEDIRGTILSSATKYEGSLCKSIKVKSLVPNYLEKDIDEDCLNDDGTGKGCVLDPRYDNQFLDNVEVIMYIKNNRVKAKVNMDESLSCK